MLAPAWDRTSIVAGNDAGPGKLWSLWDIMLKQSALEWGRVLDDLRLMAVVCGASGNLHPTPEQIHSTKIGVQDTLGNLKRVAIMSDLNDVLGPEIDRFQAALSYESLSQISGRANHLRDRIRDELQNEWYFQVDRFDVRFHDKSDHFGPSVPAKFPKATEDIKNAGNCIALQQPDAVKVRAV